PGGAALAQCENQRAGDDRSQPDQPHVLHPADVIADQHQQQDGDDGPPHHLNQVREAAVPTPLGRRLVRRVDVGPGFQFLSSHRVLLLPAARATGAFRPMIAHQARDVIADNRDRFRAAGLAAGGSNPTLRAEQAIAHQVDAIAVVRPTAVEDVQLALYAEAQRRGYAAGQFRLPRIFAGENACAELIDAVRADVVLNAVTGSLGLTSTLRALETGATLALANKESLVAGGPLVLSAARPGQIVPVDSEHSALAQALRGGRAEEVDALVLTASGGPFRGRTRADLENVTVQEAMAHPTWDMGPVITVNSATLVNKGLELIEAKLLFDVPYDRIEV